MAAGKLSPRQRMINLMYLVFIAMLAMQIDSQVLRSFQGINVSLEKTSTLGKENNDLYYTELEKKSKLDPLSYADKNELAKKLKVLSEKMYKEVETLKNNLGAEGIRNVKNEEDVDYNVLSNTDKIVKLLFLGENAKNVNKGNKSAQDFVTNINTYVKELKTLVNGDKAGLKRINSTFDYLEDKNKKSWLNRTFYEQPVVASLTNFSKLQSDIRTIEGNIVRDLLTIKPEDITLEEYEAIPKSPGYVERNKPAFIEVFIGNVSDGIEGTASVNGKSYNIIGGKAIIPVGTSATGKNTVSGSMSFKSGGKPFSLKFEDSYYVAELIAEKTPSVSGVITADKMNVVYRGLPNPISVNMSGTMSGSEQISLQSGNGSLKSNGGGKYTFTPGGGSTVTFIPSGSSLVGGKRVNGSPYTFRVKPIPPAEGQIQGSNRLALPKSAFANQRITADLPGFLFDLTLTVTEFKLKVPGQKTITCSGDRFNAAARDAINNGPKGEAAVVFDIKAKSNYGVSPDRVSPIIVALQ